jgi:hypothetical protein
VGILGSGASYVPLLQLAGCGQDDGEVEGRPKASAESLQPPQITTSTKPLDGVCFERPRRIGINKGSNVRHDSSISLVDEFGGSRWLPRYDWVLSCEPMTVVVAGVSLASTQPDSA